MDLDVVGSLDDVDGGDGSWTKKSEKRTERGGGATMKQNEGQLQLPPCYKLSRSEYEPSGMTRALFLGSAEVRKRVREIQMERSAIRGFSQLSLLVPTFLRSRIEGESGGLTSAPGDLLSLGVSDGVSSDGRSPKAAVKKGMVGLKHVREREGTRRGKEEEEGEERKGRRVDQLSKLQFQELAVA